MVGYESPEFKEEVELGDIIWKSEFIDMRVDEITKQVNISLINILVHNVHLKMDNLFVYSTGRYFFRL